MMACSKKCKHVTIFADLLAKNSQNVVLKQFESMIRKKMEKNIEE